MNKTVEIHSSASVLVQRALELILSKVETAISERGQFTIALSGGSTPKPLYEAIATQNLTWDKIGEMSVMFQQITLIAMN